MFDALEEHDGKVSIGGRNITYLRFTDGIDALAGLNSILFAIRHMHTDIYKLVRERI